MKRILMIISVLLLTGCSIFVPVKRSFPEVPEELTKSCPNLTLVPDTEKLSEVILVVVDNYTLHKECQLSVDAWNEWYAAQKKNFK